MNKRTFNFIVLSILLLSCSWHSEIYSQVTVGSGTSPIEGALLDLKEKSTTDGSVNSTKGLSMPRVELKNPNKLQLGDLEILDNDGDGQQYEKHTGLLVYNVSNISPFCPGLYVWNGSEWIRLHEQCSSGITPLGYPLPINLLSLRSVYGVSRWDA